MKKLKRDLDLEKTVKTNKRMESRKKNDQKWSFVSPLWALLSRTWNEYLGTLSASYHQRVNNK